MKYRIQKKHFILVYLSLWFFANHLFLTNYPFVHSDEPWLSGLSRSMIENFSLSSTEDFFDLYERNPHAIKILFHLLQIPFIKILGYSIFSVRLISLITGVFSLYLLYRLILQLTQSENNQWIALITTIWLSLDIQFIYISHLARQEIILILILLGMLNCTVTENFSAKKRGTFTGFLAGLAVGVHPNSFIIAWPIALLILIEIISKRKKWTEGLFFVLTTGLIAALFVGISFFFNSDFITDYRTYGAPLGILDPTDMKLLKLPGFYSKLFHQISGTYHTPNIRVQFILFPLLLVFALFNKGKRISYYSLIGFTGFNIGLVIVGKYSQPSLSFLLPFYYLSASVLIHHLLSVSGSIITPGKVIIYFLLFSSSIFTVVEITKEEEKFTDYLKQIQNEIPEETVLLGDLYMDYAVPSGQIYDWRNLSFLKTKGMTLNDYIEERNIQYIVFPEELSYIYKNRPYWNVLYGNIAHWYPQLMQYTQNECSLVKEFTSPYGIRISAYRYRQPWFVRIYKVNQSEK